MNDSTIAALLEEGLQPYRDKTRLFTPLMNYIRLLAKWNSAYNLTAVRDLPSMVTKHLLDSLAILPYLKGVRVLDVGTGAGLPGIVLALAEPERHFVLLDSNGKKTRFLQEVRRVLQLKNIEIVQSRAEHYKVLTGFDTVLSRAFKDLGQFVNLTSHLLAAQGLWLAMKGRYPAEELLSINYPYRVEEYTVAGVAGERCCVIIENS